MVSTSAAAAAAAAGSGSGAGSGPSPSPSPARGFQFAPLLHNPRISTIGPALDGGWSALINPSSNNHVTTTTTMCTSKTVRCASVHTPVGTAFVPKQSHARIVRHVVEPARYVRARHNNMDNNARTAAPSISSCLHAIDDHADAVGQRVCRVGHFVVLPTGRALDGMCVSHLTKGKKDDKFQAFRELHDAGAPVLQLDAMPGVCDDQANLRGGLGVLWRKASTIGLACVVPSSPTPTTNASDAPTACELHVPGCFNVTQRVKLGAKLTDATPAKHGAPCALVACDTGDVMRLPVIEGMHGVEPTIARAHGKVPRGRYVVARQPHPLTAVVGGADACARLVDFRAPNEGPVVIWSPTFASRIRALATTCDVPSTSSHWLLDSPSQNNVGEHLLAMATDATVALFDTRRPGMALLEWRDGVHVGAASRCATPPPDKLVLVPRAFGNRGALVALATPTHLDQGARALHAVMYPFEYGSGEEEAAAAAAAQSPDAYDGRRVVVPPQHPLPISGACCRAVGLPRRFESAAEDGNAFAPVISVMNREYVPRMLLGVHATCEGGELTTTSAWVSAGDDDDTRRFCAVASSCVALVDGTNGTRWHADDSSLAWARVKEGSGSTAARECRSSAEEEQRKRKERGELRKRERKGYSQARAQDGRRRAQPEVQEQSEEALRGHLVCGLPL
ncbi:hypothetical protein PPROV_000520300 [Pycnococcus provasolii]|uniref:Uncharacterized protein n=3 Tax=Pycnococcus provasolii TaxID=41880 RepID=A0A830HHW9_9CHLO|nr:hypothetical protein PPROV_000520300 [Pycnococcus provasolii]